MLIDSGQNAAQNLSNIAFLETARVPKQLPNDEGGIGGVRICFPTKK
jgi:hypothetical protein